MSFDVPVLFIVFNRPDTTAKVFQRIREVQPIKLFIAADGPRIGKDGEKEKCEAVRKLILEGIDWPCEVKTLFRDQNLGCGLAVSGAITWFFENVEEGIILEDDTLPDISFFPFCKTLLEKYRYDEKVKMISGNNFQRGKWRGDGSYYFSAYNHIWGWASWRRAWKYYDFTLSSVTQDEIKRKLKYYFKKKSICKYWVDIFSIMKKGEIDTWDYQWTFFIWSSYGVAILPNLNLVTNIGFGENATHTKMISSGISDVPVKKIGTILHPTNFKLNRNADRYSSKFFFGIEPKLIRGIKQRVKNFLYG
jgi:hypothetical protein